MPTRVADSWVFLSSNAQDFIEEGAIPLHHSQGDRIPEQ